MSFSGFSLSVAHMFFPIKFLWSQGNQNTWVFFVETHGLFAEVCQDLLGSFSATTFSTVSTWYRTTAWGVQWLGGEFSNASQKIQRKNCEGYRWFTWYCWCCFFRNPASTKLPTEKLGDRRIPTKTHRFSRYWLHSTEPNPITVAKVEVLGIRDGGDS